MNILGKHGIRLLVCDMAGTVVQENGAVYNAIANSLRRVNCVITEENIKQWHGRSKDEVISEVLADKYTPIVAHDKYYEAMSYFIEELREEYFEKNKIALVDPKIPTFFNELRSHGIKIGLNTGYSKDVQLDIIDHLNLTSCIDNFISTDGVARGRPYPYMIHRLMERTDIKDIKSVAKVGDTIIDMQEGRNAGCGLTIGVLSGATPRNDLLASCTADIILRKITDLA